MDKMDRGSARAARAMLAVISQKHNDGMFRPEDVLENIEGQTGFDGHVMSQYEVFTAALAMTELLVVIKSQQDAQDVGDVASRIAVLLAASEGHRDECEHRGDPGSTGPVGENEGQS